MPIQEIQLGNISSLILMRQVRALEVHWYLIINQPFFYLFEKFYDLIFPH